MKLPERLVLDASVLVAAMRPGEMRHLPARSMLEALGQMRWSLYVPVIGLAEVAAAISRATGSTARADREVALVRQLPGLSLVAVDMALGERAASVASSYRIRGCDAVYVALAQILDAGLVTLDREQQERSPFGLSAFGPEEILEYLAAL